VGTVQVTIGYLQVNASKAINQVTIGYLQANSNKAITHIKTLVVDKFAQIMSEK
jgi:hypothetical protein